MDENLFYLLKGLLTRNSIKVNDEELKLQLFGHPSYPSLHSITGVLNHFNIPNLAIEIPKTEENISFLPEHFIAHIDENRGDAFALVSKQEQNFQVIYDRRKSELISTDRFIEIWNGIVLVIEPDENVKTDSSLNLSRLLLTVSSVILTGCFFFLSQSFYGSLHFVLSMIGLSVCALILQHELGISSAVLNKICTGANNKLSCNDVMQSQGSKLFGFLKLSDLGIIYFLTTTLASLLTVISNSDFTPLFLISIVALPFTIYSIYYQFKIVKKWCLLCLNVVLVLWVQSALATVAILPITNVNFTPGSYLLIALSVYIITVLWIFIAPKIRQEQEFFNLKIQFNKFKRNFGIFNNLLSKSQPIDTKISDTNEIVFGTVDSELEIVVITNPLCGFCKNAHKLIHLVLEHETDIKIVVRFNLSKNHDASDNKIAAKLLEIYHKEGEQLCLTAMDEIYSNGSYTNWLEKWGEAKSENYSNILLSEKKWCTDNNILFTPEILLNGKSYPKEYDFEELQYFLEDLSELKEQKHTELIPD